MKLTRRSFLAAFLAGGGLQAWANPLADHLGTWAEVVTDPVQAWRRQLAHPTGVPTAVVSSQATIDAEFPWEEMKQLLSRRFRELRRHFVFEYYPWYANNPFRHWQEWERNPPLDITASSMPLLGAYDSRSAAVIEQHARWIAEAGVGVVNLSWWGPGSFSDRAVPLIMDVMHAHDIQVAFHLEPYGPERVARLPLDLQFLLREYGEKRRWDCFFLHKRANGTRGPVFKLFATTLPEWVEDCHGLRQDIPNYAPDSVWRQATDQARETLNGVFDHVTLLSDSVDAERVRRAGLDGIAIYDPAVQRKEWLNYALAATRMDMVFSFNTNPGFDEMVRRKVPSDSCYAPRPFLPEAPGLVWSKNEDRELAHELSAQRIRDTFEWSLLLQTHPWLGNVDQGFFLVYVTSFNEWHEGTQFEPMKDEITLTPQERTHGYHNPADGHYRLAELSSLLSRVC